VTTPQVPDTAMLAQIFAKLGEMGEKLAAIGETLKAVPDHEARIRALERWRYSLPLAALAALGSAGLALASFLRH
jgi:hypothetical protein